MNIGSPVVTSQEWADKFNLGRPLHGALIKIEDEPPPLADDSTIARTHVVELSVPDAFGRGLARINYRFRPQDLEPDSG